jgi:hypothetical protein
MQAKVVSIKELSDPVENPTLCLSAARVFNKCHECPVFKRAQAANRVQKLKCKPHLNPKYVELLDQKRKALDQLRNIEADLENL